MFKNYFETEHIYNWKKRNTHQIVL